METNTTSICVNSYNSGGMGLDKQNFIKTLTLFSDVLCLQEHFLLDGLQLMTNVCEKFANLHQLKFSTNVDVSKSKTKCIVFSNPVINTDNICPILLNNLPLPYVTEIKHLGNTLHSLMVLCQKMLAVNVLNLFLRYILLIKNFIMLIHPQC